MTTKTQVPEKEGIALIDTLLKLPGAIPYHGNASWQVAFRLEGGEILRFGVTDGDVAEHPGFLWVDNYEGLNGELVGARQIRKCFNHARMYSRQFIGGLKRGLS